MKTLRYAEIHADHDFSRVVAKAIFADHVDMWVWIRDQKLRLKEAAIAEDPTFEHYSFSSHCDSVDFIEE